MFPKAPGGRTGFDEDEPLYLSMLSFLLNSDITLHRNIALPCGSW